MRIIGIDPGLQRTGYGCLDCSVVGAPKILEAGVIRLKAHRPMIERLDQLFGDLTALFDEYHPDLVVVEQLFAHYKHVRTSILMGHARGVVLLAVQQCGARFDELAATEVKRAITGNGHATKRQMQYAVMGQCGLAEPPTPDDVADAIAIALCAARRGEVVA